MIFLLLTCLLSLTTTAAAATVPPLENYSGHNNNPTNHNNNNNSPQPAPETLLVDTPRIPVFVGGHWQIMSDDGQRGESFQSKLARRAGDDDDNDDTNGGDDPAATSTIELPVDTSAAAKPLPSPFDGALAANFSADNGGACPNFINQFLSDPKFKDCYAFSLLLEVSFAALLCILVLS